MRGFARIALACAVVATSVATVAAEPGAPSHPHRHHRPRYYPLPSTGPQARIPPFQPAPGIDIPPIPPGPIPTPAPRSRGGGLSFSSGMTITVTKILRDEGEKPAVSAAPIDRPKQAAERLAACWSPPLPARGETVEITIRFSFNGRGEVMGTPRTTYAKAPDGSSAEAVRNSLLDAIKTCSPLPFTKSMAASAPGYPLSVRFIGRRADERG